MQKQFLMVFLFSILLINGFTAHSFAQMMINDLNDAIVELRLSPDHIESGKGHHSIGYVNFD